MCVCVCVCARNLNESLTNGFVEVHVTMLLTTGPSYFCCRYILKNKNKMEVHILNFGGTIQRIMVSDKNEKLEDIALGYDTLDGKSDFFSLFIHD